MKKIFTTIVMVAIGIVPMFAQTQKIISELWTKGQNNSIPGIPSQFTLSTQPLITVENNGGIEILDKDFQLVKTIASISKTEDSHISAYNYTREVTRIDIRSNVAGSTVATGKTLDEFIESEKSSPLNTVTPEFIKMTIDNVECAVLLKTGINYDTDNFYASELYPNTYPIYYFKPVDGNIVSYYRTYTPVYSDWTETTPTYSTGTLTALSLLYNNLDNGNAGIPIKITQTLFNDDEDYEYILPVYQYTSEQLISSQGSSISPSYSYGSEPISTTKSEATNQYFVGLSICNSAGAEISRIDFENGFLAGENANSSYTNSLMQGIMTIGGNNYIYLQGAQKTGTNEYQNGTLIYKIEKSLSSAKMVKATSNFKASVNGNVISVTDIPQGSNAKLYSIDGKLINESQANETSTTFTVANQNTVILKVGENCIKLNIE